jgi:hypothetical protein
MKFSQKAKYFVFGLIGSGLLIPLAIKAYNTIPLTFQTGDVISANVFNNLLSRVQTATSLIAGDDFIGTWSSTQYVPFNGQPGNGSCRLNGSCNITSTTDSADGLSRFRNDTITVSKNGSAYNYQTSTYNAFVNAHLNSAENGTLGTVAGGAIFSSGGGFAYLYAQKINSEQIVLRDIQSASGAFNMIILNKVTSPPAPVNNLVASVSNSTITLTWSSLSSTQTGIKIQRTASALNPWVTIATTAPTSTSYTDNVSFTGNYFYRAISTNAYGDSISSSEVTVSVTTVSSGAGGGSGSGNGSASGSGSGSF